MTTHTKDKRLRYKKTKGQTDRQSNRYKKEVEKMWVTRIRKTDGTTKWIMKTATLFEKQGQHVSQNFPKDDILEKKDILALNL